MKTSNNKARDFVVAREAFQASNLFAEKYADVYVVYSYGYHFPMYTYANGKWYANKDKYSRTTTRHQQQVRPEWVGTDMVWVTTREMKDMIQSLLNA